MCASLTSVVISIELYKSSDLTMRAGSASRQVYLQTVLMTDYLTYPLESTFVSE